MSTIVAVCKDGEIAVSWDTGAETAGIASPNSVPRQKVQRVGENLFGITGFTVYHNILADYSLESPPSGLIDESAVFRYFIQFWRDIRERYHFVNDQSDRDSPSPFADLDSEFLVVNHTGIYHIKAMLSVAKFENFCAIGSGASHAEGAVTALLPLTLSAIRIAERAVEVACQFDTRSCGMVASLQLAQKQLGDRVAHV